MMDNKEDLEKLREYYTKVLSDVIQEGKQSTSAYIEDLEKKIENIKPSPEDGMELEK
ncbi:MAG: hypothetical protein LBG15_01125 [Dysgonamonadaceae bacterium]|jgi:septation ring formation regulator EzrA|nr:hypothetical protein [Dysgonamonadaceae bacterium]